MKKMIVLALIITLFTQSSVFAQGLSMEESIEGLRLEVPKEEIEIMEQEAMNSYMNKYNMLKSPAYEYKTELQGSNIAKKVRIGYAGNQPANGTYFSSPGGFYWTDGGYEIDVSVSVSYGIFSVSIARGSAGSSGSYISSPYINKACKLLIYKDIKVSHYKIYRRPIMGPNVWEFVNDTYTQVPVANYLDVVLVN